MKISRPSEWPIKYHLFAVFLVVILIPFSLLNVYNYYNFQHVMREKISQQDLDNLARLRTSLEDLMAIASRSMIQLQQDSLVNEMLKHPEQYSRVDLLEEMETKLDSIGNSYLLSSPPVYYTMLDRHGNVYSTFTPEERFDYNKLLELPGFRQIIQSTTTYHWVNEDPNYVISEISKSDSLISLYGKLRDTNFNTFGFIRISIDTEKWFQLGSDSLTRGESYFVMDPQGRILFHQGQLSALALPKATVGQWGIRGTLESEPADGGPKNLISYYEIPALNIYLVKSISYEVLFRELAGMQRNFTISISALTLLFIGLSYLIFNRITHPLQVLQANMRKAAATNLRISLPVDKFRGEMRILVHSFNRMIKDINMLLEKLKREAREREAVRFQVLLSQMNPHFLLNALSTIKGIANRKHNPEIVDISLSLGKVLEVSLNMEQDLIHLKKELEVVRAYCNVQSYRFDRFAEIEYDCPEELIYALVPKFCLQPLIENAYQHGFQYMSYEGKIIIRASKEADFLILDVVDNGIGMEESKKNQPAFKRKGIGLSNLEERLNLLFKQDATFQLIPRSPGLMVRMKFPLLLAKPHE